MGGAAGRESTAETGPRTFSSIVEDHPVTYADFQGEIPAGEYGGGSVETWDKGPWDPLDDPAIGMRKGSLHFVVHGHRLSGRFTLARLKQRDPRDQEACSLIKGHDEYAREGIGASEIEHEIPKMKGRNRKTPPASSTAARPLAEKPKSESIIKGRRLPAIVVARAPRKNWTAIADVELTHPERQLCRTGSFLTLIQVKGCLLRKSSPRRLR